MSIKSDNWIRRMAGEHGMIEPFAPEQVRQVDGRKIVSYGTSSYGYDVRCAGEFKIFTNINSTIVDPKLFDAKSFVDVSADVCVALVDGTAPTLEEMARRHESGELFWGYSIGPDGRMIVTLLEAPRLIGRDCLLEVTLDSGATINATPDHQFMRRDGRLAECRLLRAGDSLMPLYRDRARGYEAVYQPIDGHLCPTQRLADEWYLRHAIHADEPGSHRHPIDIDRRNNKPANPMPTAASAHIRLRNDHNDGTESSERSVLRRFPPEPAQFRGAHPYRNHKVVAIREIPGEHDVYCLTVPEAGNFALQAGVFVRNCGIICNVTPLEPEWEGHVTLEFSNTTPLPAKIYANEGVAQMLFFESDEVCSTSYRDRGGKYMGQLGVTLPKA